MSFRDNDFKPASAQPNALGALNAVTQTSLSGHKGCGLSLAAGTLVGTLTPEISVDGNTWVASRFIDVTGTLTSTVVFAVPNTAQNLSIVCLGGTAQVRVRVSAYTSGTALAYLVATDAASQGTGSGGGGGGSVTQGTIPWVVDGSGVTQPISAAALPLPTGAATQVTLAAINTKLPAALGQAAMAASLAVVVASDQSAIPISGTVAVSGTVAATQSGTWTVQPGNTANTTAWLFAGGKTNNNAAPGATNLGALIAVANAAAPTWTEGNEVLASVDLAGNQRVIAVRATTPAQSSVAGNASSVSLLASNAARKGATFFNDSSAVLYLKLGTTASTTSYTAQLASNGYYEVPFNYTGAIDGIWASATGNARITELT